MVPLGNGNDGEVIEFNPTDGLLYHASGFAGGEILESIDLDTLVVTPIPLSGNVDTEALGMAYDARSDDFLVSALDSQLHRVTTSGFVEEIGATEGRLRGLTFSRAPAFGSCDDEAAGGSVSPVSIPEPGLGMAILSGTTLLWVLARRRRR